MMKWQPMGGSLRQKRLIEAYLSEEDDDNELYSIRTYLKR
jgi:hypothetical protein